MMGKINLEAENLLEQLMPTTEQLAEFDAAKAKSKMNGEKPKKAKKSAGEFFAQVPMAAVIRLADAKYIWTVKLYPFLVYLSWRNGKDKPLKLTVAAVAPLKMGRKQKSRALRELERLGLVSVKHGERQAPDVLVDHNYKNL